MDAKIGMLLITSMIFILAIQTSSAITVSILEPSQQEYSYGTIPVSIQVLNDSGEPITADVHALVNGNQINLTLSGNRYIGQFQALSKGYYTLDAWAIVGGLNYSSSDTIYVNSTQVKIQILAPTGSYGPGQIPVKLNLYVAGKENDSENISAEILEGNKTIWSKMLEYPYNDLVNLGESRYSFIAKTNVDGTNATASTNFTVAKSQFNLAIVDPKNQTYTGTIPINIDLWSNGEFVHHVQIIGRVYSNGSLVKTFTVPEAQYHYSTQITMPPGVYTITFSADYNGNIATGSAEVTVPGIVSKNGTQIAIPGNKPMVVDEIWTNLQSRYYSTGVTGTIAVDLKDPDTGQYIKSAQIKCCVHYENTTKCQPMVYNETPFPHYQTDFTFPVEAWYEIVLNITAPGYLRTIHRFPAIKVGRPPVNAPPGSKSIKNYIFTITSPSSGITYPANTPIKIETQILDKEGMPITNANVTAKLENKTIQLKYDINGEYTAETPKLKPGKYNVQILVITNETSFTGNKTFIVSNNTISVNIISPQNNTNITGRVYLVQAEVLDTSGDIIPNANVRLIATSPKSGQHTVDMERNLSTGYYQVEYTFDSPGIWHLKVEASKTGLLPGSSQVNVNVTFPVKQTYSARDVIAALILISAVIIIDIIVRAII